MSPAEFQQGLVKFYPELYKLVGYPNLEQTEFALQKHCWNHAMSTTAHLFTKGASKEQMLSLWKKKTSEDGLEFCFRMFGHISTPNYNCVGAWPMCLPVKNPYIKKSGLWEYLQGSEKQWAVVHRGYRHIYRINMTNMEKLGNNLVRVQFLLNESSKNPLSEWCNDDQIVGRDSCPDEIKYVVFDCKDSKIVDTEWGSTTAGKKWWPGKAGENTRAWQIRWLKAPFRAACHGKSITGRKPRFKSSALSMNIQPIPNAMGWPTIKPRSSNARMNQYENKKVPKKRENIDRYSQCIDAKDYEGCVKYQMQ